MRPMRLIALLCCAAGLVASDATVVPVLELEYAGPGPVPAAAWATQWEGGRAEAAAWWSERTGTTVAATDLACTNAHLVAATRIPAGGLPRYVVAGRAQGVSPALTASWQALATRWPERQATVEGGDLVLTSADLPAPALAVTPGWRMTLHLAGAASEAAALMGPQPGDETVRNVLRLVQLLPLRLESTLDPAGRGTLTLNLPPLVLTPADAAIVARLPVAAVASGAAALDGAKAVATPLPWDDMYRELGCTRDEVAAALTGTWAAVIEDEKRMLFVVPASPLATRLVAQFDQSLVSEPWRDSLLIATDAAMFAAWKAEPATPTSGGELGLLQVDLERLVTFLTAIREDSALAPILEHLPLPQTLLGNCGLRGEAVAADLGIRGSKGPDRKGLSTLLAAQGPQRLVIGRSREGWLRCELEGSVLPWLLPAAALRWFADEAENQEGCVDLRGTIAEFKAAGAGAFPGDLLIGVPQVGAAGLAAGIAAWKALEGDQSERGNLPQEPRLAETGLLTSGEVDPALLAYHRGVTIRAAQLPEDRASTLDLRQGAKDDRLNPFMQSTCHPATRALARAGRLLALCGDISGIDLCDRAYALAANPTSVIDGLVGNSVATLRDEAYLAAVMRGILPQARAAAWQAETWAPGFANAWRGERLRFAGWMAQAWLGQEVSVPERSRDHDHDALYTLAAQAILTPRMHRAWSASDIAAMMRLERSLELDQAPLLPATSFRSIMAGLMVPAFGMIGGSVQYGEVRHGLIRLGGRVVHMTRKGPLPGDAAALGTALGVPLEVACGALRLPVVYERRGERGFRLAIDTSGTKPDGFNERTWKNWQKARQRTAETRLAFPGNPPELIWDGTQPAAESPASF